LPGLADEPASPLVRLLEGGRVPPERQPLIFEQIARRGSAADLAYLYRKALDPNGLATTIRPRALDALASAAQARGARPEADLEGLRSLLVETDPAVRLAAIRLAGLWSVRGLAGDLERLATAPTTTDTQRAASLDSLVALGGDAARTAIESLAAVDRPTSARIRAVAALVRIDPEAAALRAIEVLRKPRPDLEPSPMIAAFLSRQGGADLLAAALGKAPALPPDAAKLALRAVYAQGRSDAALVNVLSKAAGLDAEVKPLDAGELQRLLADVAAKGDPRRGELVFRRPDLSCTRCHSVAGAGGGVGPDLSAIGSSSPVDYLVHSIMLPDQAIKEQFHTLVVLTSEGQVYQGIVADRDDQRLVLKDATGETRSIPVADIEDQKEGGSLMPAGLVNLMTRDEFVDLLRFLSELGKPGPYAIGPTATIQRWRVLTGVSEALRQNVPESIQVHTELLNAEPQRWVPAYSLVSGELPLVELTAPAGSPVLYLMGEIEPSAVGAVAVRLDAPDGVALWLNSRPVPLEGSEARLDVATGLQRLIFRVDTAARKSQTLRVEVAKPPGSPAQFSVVGGR
jgi:putative heme-binding domain-containing protein